MEYARAWTQWVNDWANDFVISPLPFYRSEAKRGRLADDLADVTGFWECFYLGTVFLSFPLRGSRLL